MTWLDAGKGLVGLVVSLGVGNIVGNAVKATTPAGLNTFNKLSISIGTFVLSAMIADKAVQYVNEEIDGLLDESKKATTPVASQA